MSRTSVGVLLLVLMTACGGGGCAGHRDPALVVSDAALAETSDEALGLRFWLDLQNPNDEPLKLLRFEYDVKVNGRTVYSGARDAQATLAANGTRRLAVPAVVRFDQMDWNAAARPHRADYSISGSVQYVAPGEIAEILFDLGVRKPRAGFKGAGELDL